MKALSKKVRFEVLKRDSFTCQYCGAQAPTVVLNVDHIVPKSKGGTNTISNLITACFSCNNGKRARELSDTTVINKQKNQLDQLQAMREQIEMMAQWQLELCDISDKALNDAKEIWKRLTGWTITAHGAEKIRRLIARHGFVMVATSMRRVVSNVARFSNGKATQESVDKAFRFIHTDIDLEIKEKTNPGERQIAYIRGIIRNRICPGQFHKDAEILASIRAAVANGYTLQSIQDWATTIKHSSDFWSFVGGLRK